MRLLIVDDDADTRATLNLFFSEEGHAVSEAANGKEALDFLRKQTHGYVVILDYLMPLIDGAEVLRRAHADPALARKHAYILVSASNNLFSNSLLDVLQQIAVQHVAKPFDLDVLLDAVHRAAATLG